MERIALVTGAGRGLGRAIATRLSAEGCRVVLVSRNREELEQTASGCAGQTWVRPADVTIPEAAEEINAEIEKRWGAVEILVVNAGAGHSDRLERTTDEDWQRMLEVNLTAPFRFVRRSVGPMRKAGWGRIVVIASSAAHVGEPYLAAYTASKHGVLGLVRSAGAELARTGVTVNAVCPGFADTPMTEQTVARIVAATGRTAEEARKTLAGKQPVGRLIMPEEVADAVWYCVAGSATTGQAINVDGGMVQ